MPNVTRVDRVLRPALLLAAALGTAPVAAAEGTYHHVFNGDPQEREDFRLIGPDAGNFVHFEPDGLRIAVPAGAATTTRPIGVATRFPVKGDFETTLAFAILNDPDPKDAGPGSRLTLGLDLDVPGPQWGMGTFSWAVSEKRGRHYLAWRSFIPESGKREAGLAPTVAASKTAGRLRVTRTGSMLSYFIAEDGAEDFERLATLPFSTQDLKQIRINCINDKAPFEVRVTEFDVRAAAVPRGEVAEEAAAQGFAIWIVLGLVILLAAALWFAMRQQARRPRRLAAEDETP